MSRGLRIGAPCFLLTVTNELLWEMILTNAITSEWRIGINKPTSAVTTASVVNCIATDGVYRFYDAHLVVAVTVIFG